MPDSVLRRSVDRARRGLDREPPPARRLDQPRDTRLRMPRYDPEAFGRFAELFARFMGTPKFIIYMTGFVVIWIIANVVGLYGLKWDPYPFILLNLFFSTQASYAAPLILLAQNRQADRDRVSVDEDRRRAAAQKADTEYLAREIAALRVALGEVATRDFLRGELNRLSASLREELRDELAQRPNSRFEVDGGQKPRKSQRRARQQGGAPELR